MYVQYYVTKFKITHIMILSKKKFYPNIAPRLSTKVLIESQIFWMTPGTVLGFGSGLLVVVAPTVFLS